MAKFTRYLAEITNKNTMLKLQSKTGKVKAKQEAVFAYVSDFRNFGHLLPADRLHDIEITGETLRFAVDGLGTVGLRMAEKHPNNRVVVKAIEGTAADFTFVIDLTVAEPHVTTANINLDVNLNMFLEMMAKAPLQQFIDLMVDKLENIPFSEAV
jgi:carbon monoxide dehydrogenase subunit G